VRSSAGAAGAGAAAAAAEEGDAVRKDRPRACRPAMEAAAAAAGSTQTADLDFGPVLSTDLDRDLDPGSEQMRKHTAAAVAAAVG